MYRHSCQRPIWRSIAMFACSRVFSCRQPIDRDERAHDRAIHARDHPVRHALREYDRSTISCTDATIALYKVIVSEAWTALSGLRTESAIIFGLRLPIRLAGGVSFAHIPGPQMTPSPC